MKYAYFPGCKIPRHLPEYDISTRSVLDRLGVRLVDDLHFNCCGYPVRHQSLEAWVLSGARNLAIARRAHLTLMTPCKCCYGNLKHADYWMKQRPALREKINGMLAKEGLEWDDDIQVLHLLKALTEDVGLEAVRSRITRPLTGLKVAASYGCHALRPADVVRIDNPLSPVIFENILEAAGADPVDWPLRVECCGHPQWGKNSSLSIRLMKRKLKNAAEAEADVVATACTYCQLQFDKVRQELPLTERKHLGPESVLFTELLAWGMEVRTGSRTTEEMLSHPK